MQSFLDSEHYQAILESLPSGIYVVDQKRRILFWNDGAEQLTGYLRHEVMGKSCFADMLMHCDEDNKILCGCECPLLGTMSDGKPREAILYLRHKDGQRIPVLVRAVAIRDADGHIIGAAETFDESRPNLDLRQHPHAEAAHRRLEESGAIWDLDSVRQYLSACLEDFDEEDGPCGVLWIAIDNFAQFRSIHGAQAAEKALGIVGATLANNLRRDDVVGRATDDRFVLVISNCTAGALDRVAAKLKGIVASATIRWWGNNLAVTISAGGSTTIRGDTTASLLQRSSEALLKSTEHVAIVAK